MAKYKTVSYLKTFPLQSFSNEKIGVEIELDETDDRKEVLKEAKKFVHDFHFETNKEFYQNLSYSDEPSEVINIENKSVEDRIIEGIESCTELKVLQSYELLSKKYPKILSIYNKKLKELKI